MAAFEGVGLAAMMKSLDATARENEDGPDMHPHDPLSDYDAKTTASVARALRRTHMEKSGSSGEGFVARGCSTTNARINSRIVGQKIVR